jgi:hypothetical protein
MCVFCDHSIITVEGRTLKEYKIEYEANHSSRHAGKKICKLGITPNRLLAIKRSDAIVVVACNLNMTVELVKFEPVR